MITTGEAAAKLAVSRSRVLELIKNGQLEAQKLSGIWFVDEASVDKRLRSVNKKGGRPARGKGKDEASFTLMNRAHAIAHVVYNRNGKQFTHVGELLDEKRAPLGLSSERGKLSLTAFNDWWRNRGIPRTRSNIHELLRQARVDVPEELLQRNLGLSLSDQYWICPQDSGLLWKDVNFFDNSFEEVDARTAGFASDIAEAHAHPDNTSEGNLEKSWIIRDGARMLAKGGRFNNQEPFNEVVASALHRRLLPASEYVLYQLENSTSAARCICPLFITGEEEYIPAVYVDKVLPPSRKVNDFDHYIECCEQLGANAARSSLEHMIVCDDVVANHDRHWRNFGIVRNVETLECRPAPLFDSGSSLWCDTSLDALAHGEFSFTSRQFESNPARQLLLVEDFSWFDASRLEGFVDEAMEILSGNDLLAARLPHIRRALEWRIKRMTEIAEWS